MRNQENGVLSFAISRKELEQFSMFDLFCYAKELFTVNSVLGGATCRPRMTIEGYQRTAAGNGLDDLGDFLSTLIEEIQTIALIAQPDTNDEIKFRTLLLLMYHVDCEDDIDVHNMIAAKAMSEIAELTRRAEIANINQFRKKETVQ